MKLIEESKYQIVITDKDGNLHTDHNFTLSLRPTKNGVAGYINGTWKDGLAGKNSIIIRPEDTCGTINYVANQNQVFWNAPFFGTQFSQMPEMCQQLITFRDGVWHCILPTIGDTFKTYLRGGETGLEIVCYSDFTGLTQCKEQFSFIYETGDDPLKLVRSCAEAAAQRMGNGLKLRHQRKMPELFEYLGWCSWDSLQVWISQDGLVEKAREFRDKNVPVHFAILDDGWLNTPLLNTITHEMNYDEMTNVMHAATLDEFAGRPHLFPNGMNAAVQAIKDAGVPHVGIWFPNIGYWSGYTHDGIDAQRLGQYMTCFQNRLWYSAPPPEGGTLAPKPTREDAFGYFRALEERIKGWGCDFIKIDNQSNYKLYTDYAPIGQSSANIQAAIDEVSCEIFDGALINCMGMSSECMFNRPNTAVSRCSGDFMPEDRVWFGKNVLQSSYNGLNQGQFYVNDWDMWWTDDAQATKNSINHAISGGPIYLSDKIGRTRPEVLKPICFDDGRILRCDESATPSADCLLEDPTTVLRPFKIRNLAGNNGVMAVYNIHKDELPVSGTVRPEDSGVKPGKYAYFEYFSRACGILEEGQSLSLTLENAEDFRLYIFLPMCDVMPLGRVDKFVGVKAITEASGNTIRLYEGGSVGFISEKPIRVLCDGKELPVTRTGLLTTVSCDACQKELSWEIL